MTNEEAAIIICNLPVYGNGNYSIPEYQEAKTIAANALLNPPTAHWIKYWRGGELYTECSACKETIFNMGNYCSNCGRRMENDK